MSADPTYTVRLRNHAHDLNVDAHLPASAVPYDPAASGLAATDVQAAIDETRLDATVDRHGLLPTLSGSADEFLNGVGAYAVPAGAGAITPYYIPADETFTVPLYRQALFSEAIEVDGGLVVNGLLIGVD